MAVKKQPKTSTTAQQTSSVKEEDTSNILTADYTKHLIECKCVNPLFKEVEPMVFHKFVVFSEMDPKTYGIKPSYAQCNNCGMIHKIIDIGVSAVLKKEESTLVPSVDDIKFSLPTHLRTVLEKYDAPIHVWQEVKFIVDNKLWGRFVILSKEKDSAEATVFHGKYLIIISEALMKVETFEQEEGYISI